jgi:hypothetical protein
VASIVERIDLGCASNPMLVLISLTAALPVLMDMDDLISKLVLEGGVARLVQASIQQS